jgi:hypothetical protein
MFDDMRFNKPGLQSGEAAASWERAHKSISDERTKAITLRVKGLDMQDEGARKGCELNEIVKAAQDGLVGLTLFEEFSHLQRGIFSAIQ